MLHSKDDFSEGIEIHNILKFHETRTPEMSPSLSKKKI